MKNLASVALVLLSASLWSSHSYSSVGSDPIEVRIAIPARAAASGELFQGTLVVSGGSTSGQVTALENLSSDWTLMSVDTPLPASVNAGTTLEIRFHAIPGPALKPLSMLLTFDGQSFEREFDVSPAAVKWATEPTWVLPVTPAPGDSDEFRRPASREVGDESEGPPVEVSGDKKSTVSGKLVYQRPNANGTKTEIGGYGVYFEIRDEDLVGWRVLASGYTEADGSFSKEITWSDCWLCDRPDLYVFFRTTSTQVTVEKQGFGIDYRWRTGVKSNSTSTSVSFGSFSPPASEQPGLHLFTNIRRGWQWVKDNQQQQIIPHVRAVWPSNTGTANFYLKDFRSIYILPGSQWSEATQLHEYGHHWHNMFGNFETPTYFDLKGGIFGHCDWCSENDLAAWEEGWADWFSERITKSFLASYGVASRTNTDREWTRKCGDVLSCEAADFVLNTPSKTEGFIAAVLQDIADTGVDDEADPLSGNGWRDVLGLGTDEVFTVADQDAPSSIGGFFNAFRTRFPQHTAALWQTAENNGFHLDVAPPGAPVNFTARSTILCSPTRLGYKLQWTTPSDDWSGVAGYCVSITSTPQSPGSVQNLGPVTEYTTPCLPDGNYSCNLRAVDRVGNWGDYASYSFSVVTSWPVGGGHGGGNAIGRGGPGSIIQPALQINGSQVGSAEVSVSFSTEQAERIRVMVYDVSGRQIRSLADQVFTPGVYTIAWDGNDEAGRTAARGVYFIGRFSNSKTGSQKVIMMK